MTAQAPAPRPDILDGMRFRMISSTASTVNPDSPTRFTYHQAGALTWGEYEGDTVSTGRFVGRVTGDRVEVSFAHARVNDGQVVTGSAESVLETRDDGFLYLVEDFEKDGQLHRSVCVSMP
ncbi:hypothetical protein [Planctomonas psychrotolerans]|uniref:hypothetical protein n=1 Tax=Planctomonas psychrotolerans TaxID=2528712 RepID=UPI001D0CF93C|nr:hypothetical protein [Planctomonas psychrotolerans]